MEGDSCRYYTTLKQNQHQELVGEAPSEPWDVTTPTRRHGYSLVTRVAFITKVLYAPNIDMMK
jgi:hypothetical protein